jgi:hypothetical protein
VARFSPDPPVDVDKEFSGLAGEIDLTPSDSSDA